MNKIAITLLLLVMTAPSFASEGNYWYFSYARAGSQMMPAEFRFSGIVKCKVEPSVGTAYGEFYGDSRKGPFKSQKEADDALDRDIKRIQLVNPDTKFIRNNAKCF
ncbi:hypothetical protein D5018_18795 [Parashewanella curva]|uniref:SPOR domain-containing protein n=1 Tax=Parashewanella curva TaxID=2338552 RepID=A0A3L8PRX8_9GAMM|nr:hypothetical protein [Parashewanella curva]RLV58145.1 hypothetical protein D5018_18795 [Parashewanella curva]